MKYMDFRFLHRVATVLAAAILLGCPSGQSDDASPPLVGLVLAVGGLGDNSVNDSGHEGLQAATESLGYEYRYVEPTDATDFARHLTSFARSGAAIVFGIGFSMQEPMERVAARHPNLTFVLIDVAGDTTLANLVSLVFSEDEGAYLAGALAARVSQTGRVAFLGGMDIPLLRKWEVGFRNGAEAVNATVRVDTRFVDATVAGFSDPGKARQVALSLYRSGVDVILQVTGGSARGVYLAAEETGNYAIGSDQDQDLDLPGHVLTSVVRDLEAAIGRVLVDFQGDTLPPGVRYLNLENAGIRLTNFPNPEAPFPAPVRDALIEARQLVDSVRRSIVRGDVVVRQQ